MPSPVTPTSLIAVSPQQAAAALGLHVECIYEALRDRRLVARMYGTKRRIAVSDLIDWQRSWPEAAPPKARKATAEE
jgi:excisionase family DNA binding protein